MVIKKLIRLAVICIAFGLISACASHNNKMEDTKTLLRYGEYQAAEKEINKLLSADRNKFLRLVELGVLNQLKGDYNSSLNYLEAADKLADSLYTVSFSDLAVRASTNASLTIYRSNLVERVYINYFKMLNYFYLAEQSTSRQAMQTLLDSAGVEARRAMILLNENVFKTGDYQVAEQEKKSILYKLLQVFSKINGEVINPKALVFRDNAFSHYIIGTLFEKMDEKDSARVSYERAAKLYEQGYVKQYQLDKGTISQAWFDTARMLKARGDRRWRQVANNKLSVAQRKMLNLSTQGQGSLLLVQEVDMVAPRGELNLWAKIENDQLVIRPIPTGNSKERAYQLAWFYYLYADKGLLKVIEKIKFEQYRSLLTANHEKKISIPKALMKVLDSLELIEALSETGIRLSVPLIYYEELPIKSSYLEVMGKNQGRLILADNISGLAMAQHLVSAQSELSNAMAIEVFRLSACVNAGAPAALCVFAAASSSSADTRSWLSLPYEIRTLRTNLTAGKHTLKLVSDVEGYKLEQVQEVNIKAGEVSLVRLRTFAVDPNQPLPKTIQKIRDASTIKVTKTSQTKKRN